MENAATRSALQKAASMLVAARMKELPSHPSPDDLAAYHARVLTPLRSDQIQDHLAYCRDCSRIVMQLAPEIGAVRQYSPISDHHISEAWERFVQHLASDRAAQSPAAESAPPGRARPALAALAALLIAVASVASFSIWILQSIPQPEANIPIYTLSPEEFRRSEAGEITHLPFDAGNLILVLQASASDPFSRYGLTIEAASSPEALWGFDNLRRDERGDFTIRLPRKWLSPGQYRLRLMGLSGDQKTPLATYRIRINHPPGQ